MNKILEFLQELVKYAPLISICVTGYIAFVANRARENLQNIEQARQTELSYFEPMVVDIRFGSESKEVEYKMPTEASDVNLKGAPLVIKQIRGAVKEVYSIVDDGKNRGVSSFPVDKQVNEDIRSKEILIHITPTLQDRSGGETYQEYRFAINYLLVKGLDNQQQLNLIGYVVNTKDSKVEETLIFDETMVKLFKNSDTISLDNGNLIDVSNNEIEIRDVKPEEARELYIQALLAKGMKHELQNYTKLAHDLGIEGY